MKAGFSSKDGWIPISLSTKLILGSKFYLCKTNLYANAPNDKKLDSRIETLVSQSPQSPKCSLYGWKLKNKPLKILQLNQKLISNLFNTIISQREQKLICNQCQQMFKNIQFMRQKICILSQFHDRVLNFQKLDFRTAVKKTLWQQQYDNENSELSMISLCQKFTESFQTCPHELSKIFSLLWCDSRIISDLVYLLQPTIKTWNNLMMTAQLKKLSL